MSQSAEDTASSNAPGVLVNAPDTPGPSTAFRWRPEELFASRTARGGLAGLAVVSVILGTVGFVAVSIPINLRTPLIYFPSHTQSAIAIVFHNLFVSPFSPRKSQEPAVATIILQFPTLPNPRRNLHAHTHAAAYSLLGPSDNVPPRPNYARKPAGVPLLSRTSSTGTGTSEEALHCATTGSDEVETSLLGGLERPQSDSSSSLDLGGCALHSNAQCTRINCHHTSFPSPLIESTISDANAILPITAAGAAGGSGRGGSNSSPVPPTARNEPPTGGYKATSTGIAAICSHNHACATASGSTGSTNIARSPPHSHPSADATSVEHTREFGHGYPDVFRNSFAASNIKSDLDRDKGRKIGGLRKIREVFRRNTSTPRSPSTSATAMSGDERRSSLDDQPHGDARRGHGRVTSGQSDDSLISAINSPQRKSASLPQPSAPFVPAPASGTGPSRQQQQQQPTLLLSMPSPTDSVSSIPTFARPAPLSSSTTPHGVAFVHPETSTSTSFPSSTAPPTPTPHPILHTHTSKPVFRRPNILKRPSSPLRPSTSNSSAPPDTSTQPLPSPDVLRRSATSANAASAPRGKNKKCGMKKTKPPPLRTTYTYTFAPSLSSPEPEPDLPSESREVSDVEGGGRGRRTLGGGGVGGEEPLTLRRSSSLNAGTGTGRSKPRTASGDDQIHHAHQRPNNGVKRAATMMPERVVPIFVPLAPRVAGSLPRGVSINYAASGSMAFVAPGSVPTSVPPSHPIRGASAAEAASIALSSAPAPAMSVSDDGVSTGLGLEGVSEFGQRVCRRSMPPPPRNNAAASLVATSIPPHVTGDALAPAEAVLVNNSALDRTKDKKENRRFSLR